MAVLVTVLVIEMVNVCGSSLMAVLVILAAYRAKE
jgi:hypothetical protein